MIQNNLFEYLKQNTSTQLFLVEDTKEATLVSDTLSFLNKPHLVFPDFRASYLDDLRSYQEELQELFSALKAFYQNPKQAVVAPLATLCHVLPQADLLQSFSLEFASMVSFSNLKETLIHWGYSFVDIIQAKGEVSFRGDIMDIFPPSVKEPFRISFFDDEIENIRTFDLQSQKSHKEELESIHITPAFLALEKSAYEEIINQIEQSQSDSFVKDIHSLGFWYIKGENFLLNKEAIFVKDMQKRLDELYEFSRFSVPKECFSFDVIAEAKEFKELIVTDAKSLVEVHKEKNITLIAKNEAVFKQSLIEPEVRFNIVYQDVIVNLISADELIISLNQKRKRKRKKRSNIILDELKLGDYVVHDEYGIGVFESITQATILGGTKDFVSIKYQGEDKVLLPVENLEMIDRFVADSGSLPVLDKLGKGSFGKLKEKVKKKLLEIAGKIIHTAAQRELIKAPVLQVAGNLLQNFQRQAGFEYTLDQERSVDEIKTSLAQSKPMDRLLSGDVGFGKTEVAMNALFIAAKSGMQSALVVPTTLLSNQHYKSLEERFAEDGIKIARLDRFVSTKEKKMILESLKEGHIDIVVGTHSLFGVEFKQLGLVIIDEEHKFGVKQKEKLKAFYEKTHLLSMSATPIPRSLNLALSSVKTMSSLTTPPSEREGIRTFVKEYDEKLIKEVIKRELRRGGQVFYVFNSIANMPQKQKELQEIMPELRILALHSKISATVTEKELLRFQNKEYDVLLATSIIESGIHMPSVNTMVIDGADRFGIADLHQLRGRVGRSNKEGFAYFIVEDKDSLTDEAKKRLVALESNSFLGSGSVLAYHDLEIRGGGNIVGEAQSGHIKNIGYSLYLKMLEDAIGELTNKTEGQRQSIDIKLTVNSFINAELVSEDRLRLELYRRLSQCEEVREVYEIEEEIIDRFGKPDATTKQFLEIVVIKLLGLRAKIKTISNYQQNITFEYQDGKKELVKARSKDDDDLLAETLKYLRAKGEA